MISLLAVLIPILAKRMTKIMMIAIEMNPPVAVVYYASPLYLRNLLLGNRSKNCSIFLKQEQAVIFIQRLVTKIISI